MFPPFLRRRSLLPWYWELPAAVLARALYRVRSSGAEDFPRSGGVLLIMNHISYVDAVVMQLACPRPIRFVGHRGLRRHRFFDWVFQVTGAIATEPGRSHEGLTDAIRSLQRGEVLCLCPEGHVSRTGQLMRLDPGFETIAREARVPVVAAAIDGLWGSIFSFAGNKYLWKSPRLMPTPVFVAFGPPAASPEATVAWGRQQLLDLGEAAFEQRPVLRRHVGREAVRALTRHPRRLLLVDRTAARRPLRCGQVYAAAAVLSKRIRETVAEPRVGIVLPPGAGAFIANLAAVMAGKVAVNLNFTAGRAALEASLRIAGIRTVISARAMQAKVPGFPWPERTLDLATEITAAGGKRALLPWLVAAWFLPNQWCADLLGLPRTGDRAEAALLFTSGSSGDPKGVALTHRNILANCAQISSLSILPESTSLLGCLPIFHSFGFTVTLWYPILRGCRVATVPSPLDTRRIADAIREEKVTVLVGAPTFVRPLLKKARSAELASLELVVTGAEKLPEDLRQEFRRSFHLGILQGYGLTETSPVANINQPDPLEVDALNPAQPGHRSGSVGRMMPGMTARIADPDTLVERALTDTGMVLFRGSNVFSGYLDDPARTAAAFRQGWFVTGDLGRFDHDGFLFIEGRLSRFSKIGGEMVPHGTVEQKVAEAFGWDATESPAAAVVGVPDASKGEALVLLATRAVSADDVRARLLALGVPNLWVPRIVLQVDAIPVLGSGKMDVNACRQLAAAVRPG